jgi:acetate kinase
MKRLDEIFDIKNSPSLELINCKQVENGVRFVSRTSANNGIVARIKQLDDLEPMPANALTVALGGSVLSSFYQEEPFYTAFHIACLYPKQELTKEQMLYYAYVIEQNKYRYNYGIKHSGT